MNRATGRMVHYPSMSYMKEDGKEMGWKEGERKLLRPRYSTSDEWEILTYIGRRS